MVDIPELPPMQQMNLQAMSDSEIEAYAEGLSKTAKAKKHGVTKDELISWLKEMKGKGIKLTSSRLDSLLSGSPILDKPTMNLEDMLDYFDRESAGNPFLRASLLTIFTMVFMELTAQMAEIGLTESEIVADTILLLKEIGLFKAEMKLKIAEMEHDMEKAAMVAAIVSAAAAGVSLGIGVAGTKMGWGDMTTGSAMTAAGQIMSKTAEAVEHGIKGTKILEKGGYEAFLELYNTITSIFERRMQSAGEAQKEYRDLITKFLDAYNQMAHSIQTGFGINPEKGG